MIRNPRSNPGIGSIEINAAKFYKMVDLAKSVDADALKELDDHASVLDGECNAIDEEVENLAKANNAMMAEIRQSSRRQNPFATPEENEDIFSDLRHSIDGHNFLRVIFDVTRAIQLAYHDQRAIARGLRPGDLVLSKNRSKVTNEFDSIEELERSMYERELNQGTLSRFLDGIIRAERSKMQIIGLGRVVVDKMESYYNTLQHRHSVEGIKIHVDPVVTDLALTIFENVDAHGEIKDGKKPDEISAYSMRKALILIDTIKDGNVGGMTRNPDLLINFMEQHMKKLWDLAENLEEIAKPLAEKARDILGPTLSRARTMSKGEFDTGLTYLRDVDPRNITYKEKTGLLTSEERYALNFRNTTLAKVATKLNATTASSAQDIVQYILRRKHELHQYYTEENSFYVCKVGAGNPFLGEAPGELTVHPGTRPVVNLDEIIGSGFGDIKEFMGHIEQSSKWHSLFLATSPSRTADKSNVLLIGPQGCGKSEILRAVGGDKQSIGIFATGSDFLTCWKGEAEKNPKRLFEAANKLQKESKKHVHILIDEIDTILNKASGREAFGSTNLVTEFQNLMDGIVHYPHLSVWGATNVPENIPLPCLRRFSKVAIVGELDQADRVRLLKHFASFMPVDDDITDEQWGLLAKRCVGATGDVLRKVVDHVWREKIAFFTKNHNEKAQELATWLNETQEQQFSIADFTGDQRTSFHSLLKPMVRIHAKDLDHSITLALENVAVRNEIKTATETYDKAKAFLASIRKQQPAEAAAE